MKPTLVYVALILLAAFLYCLAHWAMITVSIMAVVMLAYTLHQRRQFHSLPDKQPKLSRRHTT
jgi:hypothetical protein